MSSVQNKAIIPVDSEQLRQWCTSKLVKVGVVEDHAAIVADVLVHANLRGVDSHGVLRMEHYVEKVRQGGIKSQAVMTVRHTGSSSSIVDADDGFGQVAAKIGMQEAMRLAKTSGIGAVSIINSSHCGALSYFAQMAADERFIGMVMTNTDKLVVPFGGKSAYFGTNPLAFGFPAGNRPSIILDMATSSVAYGKILEALHLNKSIPDSWAVDASGQPTTNPDHFAALLPFGGPKGYGLAMVIDIFAGILTGSPFGPYILPMYNNDLSLQRKLGHFMLAIDIGKFTDPEIFIHNIHRMMDDLQRMSPAPGFDSVKLPGEIELQCQKQRTLAGIPLTEDLIRYLSCE